MKGSEENREYKCQFATCAREKVAAGNMAAMIPETYRERKAR